MKFLQLIVIFLLLFSFKNIVAQSHAQRAAITHVRMTQQMNHSFHMMRLNMANNSARSVKKNVKYINKRLKHNEKAVAKYKKKRIQLEQKLNNTNINDAKKQRLKKRILIYQEAIDAFNKKNTELKPLLQKQKEFIDEKEAEKLAKRKARKERRLKK